MSTTTLSTQVDAQGQQERFVDIIWNVTLVCPWDCEICCVDAVHVSKKQQVIQLRSRGLSQTDTIAYRPGEGSIFDQAMRQRQQEGKELSFEQKLQILHHLEGFRPKLDFSGGDPLSASENYKVMQLASQRFGREAITLTATGAGLARYVVEDIAPFIGELNFTYDNPLQEGYQCRPAGYADGNLRKAAKFAQAGVKTRGECPLTVYNAQEETLRQIYLNLHESGIDKLLLMRLFQSGRGVFHPSDSPTPDLYRRSIDFLREMEAKYTYPQLKLQCALKFFDRKDLAENPCDLLRESFGLMTDGTLLTSPWAIGGHGRPIDDAWVLGNLVETPLKDLLATPKAQEYTKRLDENFGNCKIFSFLHSTRERPLDRIFDNADPLYNPAYSLEARAAAI